MNACGSVISARGNAIEALLPAARIGQRVLIGPAQRQVVGSVTALQGNACTIVPGGEAGGIALGDPVRARHSRERRYGTSLLGCSIPPDACVQLPPSPEPADRRPLQTPLWTGVRTIDGLLAFARGARIGVFGPPGAGKSMLLHCIARNARADAVVLALVGERGREAQEWMRAAPAHATTVCATSDRPAVLRVAAAHTAMVQAAALRDRGLHVLLVFDSLARYANALREIALECGEPVGRGGFPPSVFAQLARLLEVAGTARMGSMSLVASVLSDGDERDPVSDAARSLLDGHLQLCPGLAAAGHFPAIDVLQSTSRTMRQASDDGHREDAARVRSALAALRETADARALGILPPFPGAERVEAFLRQGEQASLPEETLSALAALADTLR